MLSLYVPTHTHTTAMEVHSRSAREYLRARRAQRLPTNNWVRIMESVSMCKASLANPLNTNTPMVHRAALKPFQSFTPKVQHRTELIYLRASTFGPRSNYWMCVCTRKIENCRSETHSQHCTHGFFLCTMIQYFFFVAASSSFSVGVEKESTIAATTKHVRLNVCDA